MKFGGNMNTEVNVPWLINWMVELGATWYCLVFSLHFSTTQSRPKLEIQLRQKSYYSASHIPPSLQGPIYLCFVSSTISNCSSLDGNGYHLGLNKYTSSVSLVGGHSFNNLHMTQIILFNNMIWVIYKWLKEWPPTNNNIVLPCIMFDAICPLNYEYYFVVVVETTALTQLWACWELNTF